ncbi:MAG TPA: alpha/beta fold hydrolase, partial [Dongiaceae bacterium]|nr:alpha/beta fold hydrolase [Dongiaceae bacterium]
GTVPEPATTALYQEARTRLKDAPPSAPAIVGADRSAASDEKQDIRFCMTADGVRIAFASAGKGPPLVKCANWLNHLEFDWQSPVWRHLLRELSSEFRLIRYDERGNGLSDWKVDDFSYEALVRDLESVVDAAGLDRFPLLGISQGCAVAIGYAVRHPERVTRLVLHGGYAKGWRKRSNPSEIARREAMLTLVREGWGQENPAFRQIFTSWYIPDGSPEQWRWWNDLQRISTSPENAARLMIELGKIDVSHMLAQVSVPTLVTHSVNDAAVPFSSGRELASSIPGARFVPLESCNHVILDHEPAWPRFLEEIRAFLHEDGDTVRRRSAG